MTSEFNGKRITIGNSTLYLREKYKTSDVKLVSYESLNINALSQSELGTKEDNDCTLSSITEVARFYSPSHNEDEIYSIVQKNASRCMYASSIGTIPFFNKTIANTTFKNLGIDHKFKAAYIKDVGFNFNMILDMLKDKKPVILSITNDGRDFYKGHTITVVGYAVYKVKSQQVIMLMVHDN